jgi:hypothetical protein
MSETKTKVSLCSSQIIAFYPHFCHSILQTDTTGIVGLDYPMQVNKRDQL